MIQEKVFCASKTEGRIKAFLLALNQMLNTPEKLWCNVINETRDLVNRNRQNRGAMDRPVFKSKDFYLDEFRSTVEQNGQVSSEMMDTQME